MAEYIEFSLNKTSKTVPIFAMLYSNYIHIDVPGLDESCVNDFTTDVEESAQSWLSTTGFSYVIPTFNNEVIEDAAPHIDAGFSVTENNGAERTGVITVSHVGGWSATYTVTQKAGLTVDDIPEDAYKEIVPGTTPWFSTRNQEDFPDYNWDRAEKVLYMTGDCLRKPSASLYVPESWITEDTIVRCCIEADENSRNTISDWLYDFGEDNGWWTSTDYPGFKHYGYDVGSRYVFEMTTVTHRTVKLTFVLCNYNGETGNYFAIPFRIVQCKKGITKAEFDELVKLYGPSNYDGTMNNLDRFGFEDDTESTDQTVVPGVTPWVEIPDREIKNSSVYPFSESDNFIANYGKADKVLYVPDIYPVTMPYIYIYIPKSYITDDTTIYVDYETNEYNATENRLYSIFPVDKLNAKPSTWSDSSDYPMFKYKSFSFNSIALYQIDQWNISKDPAYFKLIFRISNYNGKTGNTFEIPFTLVNLRKSVPTKADLDKAVATYGVSNYDGTMQNLNMFHFDALAENPYLQICPNCLKFKYDSNSHLCSHCDYSDTYKPKSGLPYFAIAGVVSNHTYFSKSKGYCLCNVTGGTNGGSPSGFPSEIYFPSSLGISNNEEITVNYDIVPIYPAGSNTDWVKLQVSNELSSNDSNGCSIPLDIDIALNNKTGNDYRVAKIVFTITAPVNGQTVTYKDATLEYTLIQGGCGLGPSIPGLKELYGTEYHKSLYVQPDNMKPYPEPSTPGTPSTPEQLIVPEGKFTSDSLTISADGGTFWTRFDITNMTYEYYNNLVSPRGKAHSAEVTWRNEKFFSDENEWVYGNLGAVNTHLKKDRTTGKPYLYVKYSINPNTTNYKLTSYMMYRYWGTIKGAAQINADPLFECKIPVYQLPASDTITKTESLPDKPVGITGETAVGAVECGYTNTLDVFAIAEEDIKTKLNVYSTAEWLKIKDITYNKN